jgi:hypothetical protein
VRVVSVADGSAGICKSDAIGILLKPAVGVAVDDVLDSLDPLTLDKSEEAAVHELWKKRKEARGFIKPESDDDSIN